MTRTRVLASSIVVSLIVISSLGHGFYQEKQTAVFEQKARVAADGRAKEQERAAQLESSLKNEAQKRADEQTKVADLQKRLAAKAKQGERQAQETARDQRVLAQVADSYQGSTASRFRR